MRKQLKTSIGTKKRTIFRSTNWDWCAYRLFFFFFSSPSGHFRTTVEAQKHKKLSAALLWELEGSWFVSPLDGRSGVHGTLPQLCWLRCCDRAAYAGGVQRRGDVPQISLATQPWWRSRNQIVQFPPETPLINRSCATKGLLHWELSFFPLLFFCCKESICVSPAANVSGGHLLQYKPLFVQSVCLPLIRAEPNDTSGAGHHISSILLHVQCTLCGSPAWNERPLVFALSGSEILVLEVGAMLIKLFSQ